jgi:Lon protease-like protein
VAHHQLEDGRYNLLLLGVGRVRVVRELDPLRSFRQAQVELVEDCYDFSSAVAAEKMQQTLIAAFRKHLPCACQVPEQLEELLSRHLPLGLLTDLAAYALPLDAAIKRQLLSERRVSVRAETLLGQIEGSLQGEPAAPRRAGFPPLFSIN